MNEGKGVDRLAQVLKHEKRLATRALRVHFHSSQALTLTGLVFVFSSPGFDPQRAHQFVVSHPVLTSCGGSLLGASQHITDTDKHDALLSLLFLMHSAYPPRRSLHQFQLRTCFCLMDIFLQIGLLDVAVAVLFEFGNCAVP